MLARHWPATAILLVKVGLVPARMLMEMLEELVLVLVLRVSLGSEPQGSWVQGLELLTLVATAQLAPVEVLCSHLSLHSKPIANPCHLRHHRQQMLLWLSAQLLRTWQPVLQASGRAGA